MMQTRVRLTVSTAILAIAACVATASAVAAETRVLVHVVSQDAKLIGTGVGGAWVSVTDAGSGRLLAEGEHLGSTGDTDLIMRRKPQTRDSTRFTTEGAAGFLATFEIDQPTVIEIAATGPLGNPQASMRASTRMLVLPGAEVLGDGVVLTLHGFNIAILEPDAGVRAAGDSLRVLADVRMMCGCPLTPGGLWDADTTTVTARLLQGGKVVAEAPLAYAGEASRFAGEISPPSAGAYELEVLASQASTANFGRAASSLAVAD